MKNIRIHKVAAVHNSELTPCDPKIATPCQHCIYNDGCEVKYLEQCSWLMYARDELPNTIRRRKGGVVISTLSQRDIKYQWKYVMRTWEKICTLILLIVVIGIIILIVWR